MPEIARQAFPFVLGRGEQALVVIDMQRDFLEPGGFGAALGNDVARLQAIVPAARRLLEACREAGIPVDPHERMSAPDLSDCPPAKRDRGLPSLRIGDRGPMGPILVRGGGEPGVEIVPELAPLPGRACRRQARQGWGSVGLPNTTPSVRHSDGIPHLLKNIHEIPWS